MVAEIVGVFGVDPACWIARVCQLDRFTAKTASGPSVHVTFEVLVPDNGERCQDDVLPDPRQLVVLLESDVGIGWDRSGVVGPSRGFVFERSSGRVTLVPEQSKVPSLTQAALDEETPSRVAITFVIASSTLISMGRSSQQPLTATDLVLAAQRRQPGAAAEGRQRFEV